MQLIKTSIDINAPPSVVHQTFLDFPSYPEWNPFITSLESPIPSPIAGTRIKFVANGRPIESTVLENTPQTFNWKGVFIAEWFFAGRHCFDFEPLGDLGDGGETISCKLVHYEKFTGIAVWPLMLLLRSPTEKGFNEMNKALKARVEERHPGSS